MQNLPKSVFVVLTLLTFSACFCVYTAIHVDAFADNVRGLSSLEKVQQYFIGTLFITAPLSLSALATIIAVRSFAVKFLSVVTVFAMALNSWLALSSHGPVPHD